MFIPSDSGLLGKYKPKPIGYLAPIPSLFCFCTFTIASRLSNPHSLPLLVRSSVNPHRTLSPPSILAFLPAIPPVSPVCHPCHPCHLVSPSVTRVSGVTAGVSWPVPSGRRPVAHLTC